MQWYYAQDGQQIGPIEEFDFRALLQSGAIRAETLVWHDGLTDWQPLESVRGSQPLPSANVHYAGFWIRALARLIDSFVVFLIGMAMMVPLALLLGLAAMPGGVATRGPAALLMRSVFLLIGGIISATYDIYFVSTRGATPGKKFMGLRIIRADGAPLTRGLASSRFLASLLSGYLLMIGNLMAAFDREKRSLHDRICQTRVVHTR